MFVRSDMAENVSPTDSRCDAFLPTEHGKIRHVRPWSARSNLYLRWTCFGLGSDSGTVSYGWSVSPASLMSDLSYA